MNILSIKLHRPAPPANRIPRPALLLRLDEGLNQGRPMTLVSAPAGFGKSTCVGEWLAGQTLPVAWLSLDADDNDPGRFFSYLVAALHTAGAFPRLGEIESVLRAGQLPPLDLLTDALISDVAAFPGRFLLVLDDFHLIQDASILKVFEKLLTTLFASPLAQPALHLVLLTREDPTLPLARLRAGGRLTEIRAADLRFSTVEAGQFLTGGMDLNLSPAEIAALADKTEGWPAGLQLAGLSLRGRPDPARFIAGLTGSHRFILSYLTEEVLNRQTEDIQRFLLETSILDRLTGDLCNALTGRSDSHALLEQLCRANLFLVPLDDEQRWYRYHHLFADLLRSRLKTLYPGQSAALHRRAGDWYAQATDENGLGRPASGKYASGKFALGKFALGERAALASSAIQHALAAEDYPAAVERIEAHAAEILNLWYARVVTGWMQALPPEWAARSPRASLAFVRMHLIRGDFAQAMPYLERLQAVFSDPQSAVELAPGLRAEWLALQSSLCGVQGRRSEALALAEQALALAPENEPRARCQVYLALSSAFQQMEDIPRAIEGYHRLIQLGRSAEDLISELLGLSALALLLIQRGKLHAGFELAAQGAERLEQSGTLPPICAGLYGELGQIYFHWLQFEPAERFLERAAQVSMLAGFSDAGVFHAVFRSRLCQLRGDLEGAAAEIHKAAGLARADAPVVVREEVIACQVQVAVAQGQLAAAQGILTGANSLPAAVIEPNISYPQAVIQNSILRLRLHQLPGMSPTERKAVFAWAGQLIDTLRRREFVPLVLEALLLRAQLYQSLEDPAAGLADLSAALDLAEPEGYRSVFVLEGPPVAHALAHLLERTPPGSARRQFIQELLGAFPGAGDPLTGAGSQPPGQAALYEPLTARELDVLRLMTEGQTYEEIAARMVVSINTVRTHVKAIYGKLGVNNRTAALETARRLNLL